MTAASTLTWLAAVDAAFDPTDLDRSLKTTGLFGTGEPRIGADGKIAVARLIRERAALAYMAAHAGETVTVAYADPAHVDDRSRLVYRTSGILGDKTIVFPVFDAERPEVIRSMQALLVGGVAVPVAGITEIRTADDRSTVTL